MPYASIIIPTHDRAETLPYSLRSALAQTVTDIEVLIVGDGCTPQVRAVAESFAGMDSRVRFLDLPKAPMRGAENRHRAVLAAAAERVFYNDDDDLLLAHHVATLGAALDSGADVVDTPAASIHLDGTIHLGIHNSDSATIRRLLAAETYKAVYDTHLAHTKRAYVSGDGAWMRANDRRVVLHMLKYFAANPRLGWRTLQRITALSLHGMCRVGMSGADRAQELATWEAQIANSESFEATARQEGSYVFHSARLLHLRRDEALPDILTDQDASNLPADKQAALEALHLLYRGQRPAIDAARLAFDGMLEARLGPEFPTKRCVALFRQQFSPTELQDLIEDCAPRPAVTLAKLHLEAQATAQVSAASLDVAAAAMDGCLMGPRFFFAAAIADALIHVGRLDETWTWLERIEPMAPASHTVQFYWRLREQVAAALGLTAAAQAARDRAEALALSMI